MTHVSKLCALSAVLLLSASCKSSTARLDDVQAASESPLRYIKNESHVVNPKMFTGQDYSPQCVERWMDTFFKDDLSEDSLSIRGYRAAERLQDWWLEHGRHRIMIDLEWSALRPDPKLGDQYTWVTLPRFRFELLVKDFPLASAHFINLIISGALLNDDLDAYSANLITKWLEAEGDKAYAPSVDAISWDEGNNLYCRLVGQWQLMKELDTLYSPRASGANRNQLCQTINGRYTDWVLQTVQNPWQALVETGFILDPSMRVANGKIEWGLPPSRAPIHAVLSSQEGINANRHQFRAGDLVVPMLGWDTLKDIPQQKDTFIGGRISIANWSMIQRAASFADVRTLFDNDIPIPIATVHAVMDTQMQWSDSADTIQQALYDLFDTSTTKALQISHVSILAANSKNVLDQRTRNPKPPVIINPAINPPEGVPKTCVITVPASLVP